MCECFVCFEATVELAQAGAVVVPEIMIPLVSARRDGKAIYYSIKDPKAGAIMELVYDMFCNPSR